MFEEFREPWCSRVLHRVVIRALKESFRIPFFFEANFDALVEPLRAARRIQDEDRANRQDKEPLKVYEPVMYGDFLLKKLAGNYATSGQGRYGTI